MKPKHAKRWERIRSIGRNLFVLCYMLAVTIVTFIGNYLIGNKIGLPSILGVLTGSFGTSLFFWYYSEATYREYLVEVERSQSSRN